jgi:hypothetical protein
MDDPQLTLTMFESTVDSLVALLNALATMCEPGAESLTAEQRGFLTQALDLAADLDLLFGELAVSLERARPHA